MSSGPSHLKMLNLVYEAGGVVEDWRLAKQLKLSTRSLAERMESLVAAGSLRRFHNKRSMPCYGLTDEGLGVLERTMLVGSLAQEGDEGA